VAFWAQDGEGNIVADIAAFEDASHLQSFNLTTLRPHSEKIPRTHLRRYIVPLTSEANDIT
jgi:hypothetical protein